MEHQRARDVEMVYWRWKLQRIFFTAVAFDLTLILMVLVSSLIPMVGRETAMGVCTSPACMNEASRIARQVNLRANPCENLYDFVCGKPQANSDPIIAVKEEAKQHIIELYKEPIKTDEYPMVITMKKLFRACLDETTFDISPLSLVKIKEALEKVGGWPLLEGPKWVEEKFDWLQATYKFREMGYHHSVFLNLSVSEDRRNRNRHLIKVSLPKLDVVLKPSVMEVAALFGANENQASFEIDETYNYMLQLFYESKSLLWSDEEHHVLLSAAKYQEEQGHESTINWLEFVNKIIGLAAQISDKDLVLFSQPEKMSVWLNSLAKIPKRVQANYMMWKITEELLADLRFDTQRKNQFLYSREHIKEHGCLEKIQNRFQIFPNPIDVLYVKKYLPQSKIKMVEELVNNVKMTFLEQLGKSNWLETADKEIIINAITKEVIIGAPKRYFDDKILDEINIDMKEANNDSFLSLLLQVGRNYQSLLYKQIYWPVNETKSLLWNLLSATDDSLHYYGKNSITLPATILQGTFFNENRPNYLNYGSLGSFIAAEFACQLTETTLAEKEATTWSDKTQKGFLKIRRCFLKQVMDNLKINGVRAEWDYQMLHQTLSTNITYLAYKKWEEGNGVEPKLASTAYTNHQLFWISAAGFYCQQLHPLPSIFGINKQYSFYANGIGMNNKNFAEDFNCPLTSKMDPREKCYVF